MDGMNNWIAASGRLEGGLTMSHEVMDEVFYTGTFAVKRTSGALDRLPVTGPGRLAGLLGEAGDMPLRLEGQIRSYNRVEKGASRLLVTLFVRDVSTSPDDDTQNSVIIDGALCRPPVYRSTPFGREICDMMLAVSRSFGKNDYIPCIAWGRNARSAAGLAVGDRLSITGRLQSREYQKLLDDGSCLTRSVCEVSAFTLKKAEDRHMYVPAS